MSPLIKYTSLLIVVVAAAVLPGCRPTRKLGKGEYLLVHNEIVNVPAGIDKDEIASYVKQKPNRKLLAIEQEHFKFRLFFHLGIYNLVNQEKMRKKRQRYEARIDAKNLRRAKKGKSPKSKNRLTLREWLIDIGEAPVVLDSILMRKSTRQLQLFLDNKGYFNNSVTDSVTTQGNKATVFYTIIPRKPYTIRKIDYRIEDELLAYYVYNDTAARLINQGDIYDGDKLQAERDRITRSLKNEGYYYFTREYIYFTGDSSLRTNQIDITIGIKKFTTSSRTDSAVTEANHQRYYVNRVYIQTDFIPGLADTARLDTSYYFHEGNRESGSPDYIFLHRGRLQYRPFVIVDEVELQKNKVYQQADAENTYRGLADLKAFKLVSITFREAGADRLDAYIQLTPVLRQAFTTEMEGTNTQGSYGVAGGGVYQNNNTFRAAELLEVRLKGALEAQKLINESGEANNNTLSFFNTIEVGPEVRLNIPRPLFPFNVFDYNKVANPRTSVSSMYNFQKRPDFTRSLYNLSYSFTWRDNLPSYRRGVLRHSFYPIEINFVKVDPSPAFQRDLEIKNNLLLRNQFTDHLTTSTRWSSTYSTQQPKRKHYIYLRGTAESSGFTLQQFHDLVKADTDSMGRYRISNVVFSQYIRFDADARFYTNLTEHKQLVFRIAGGEGFPYGNLEVLPFERSFFSGGSNSIRAWRARSLGPGSFHSAFGESFDQIGDIQIESNFEYRFNVIKMVNAALFIDAGNIWLRKPDPKRPQGEFEWDRFYKEFAVGTGAGLRVDFSFFIVRLDAGLRVRDPKFGEEGRWVITRLFDSAWQENYSVYYSTPTKKVEYSFVNFNLGINYPF